MSLNGKPGTMRGPLPPEVEAMRSVLARTILPWQQDGCSPANFVRYNGLGIAIARVDRWCGGYQCPHTPSTIGFEVRVVDGLRHMPSASGVVEVALNPSQAQIDSAIASAKRAVNEVIAVLVRSYGYRAYNHNHDLLTAEGITEASEVSDANLHP